MNCVAAVVSTQFPDPSEAFKRFCAIVTRIRGLWLPGFPLFVSGMDAFEALYWQKLPKLYSHFNEQSVTFDMFLADAWLTLFSRWLPFVLLWNAFELIEAEGFPGVLCLTAALLEVHATALAEAEDFTSLFVMLKALDKQPQQPEGRELIAAARALLPAAREVMGQNSNSMATKDRSYSFMSVMSVKREGPKVIHAASGLEILQETSSDVQVMAQVFAEASGKPSKSCKAAEMSVIEEGTAASGTTSPHTARSPLQRRRMSCCLPCGSESRKAATRGES